MLYSLSFTIGFGVRHGTHGTHHTTGDITQFGGILTAAGRMMFIGTISTHGITIVHIAPIVIQRSYTMVSGACTTGVAAATMQHVIRKEVSKVATQECATHEVLKAIELPPTLVQPMQQHAQVIVQQDKATRAHSIVAMSEPTHV